MIPLELTITNFRSYHGPLTIDFRGLRRVCIIGPNGAGKSSIISAMLWALYGKSNTRTNSDLIRRGADFCEISLTFEAENNVYKIDRQVRSSGVSKAQIYHISGRGHDLIVDGAKKVESWLSSNLRLNYDTTINASVLLQGKADRFSTMSPADRKKFLSDVLGLSICDKIATLSRGKVKELTARIESKRSEIERLQALIDDLSDIPDRLNIAKKELEAAESAEKTANRSYAEIRERKNSVDRDLGELRLFEERYNALCKEINETKYAIEEASKGIAELKAIIDRGQEIETGWEKLEQVRAKREKLIEAKSTKLQLQGDLALVESEIEKWKAAVKLETERFRESRKGIAGQIAEIERLLAKESFIRERYAELIDARKAYGGLRESKETADAILKRIEQIDAIIETKKVGVENSLREKRNALLQIKIEDIQFLSKELAEIEERLAKKPQLRADRDSLQERGEAAKARIEALCAERGEVSTNIAEIQEKITLLHGEVASKCPLCGQKLDNEHREAVIKDLASEVDLKKERISKIEEESLKLEAEVVKLRKAWLKSSGEIGELEKLDGEGANLRIRIEKAHDAKSAAAALSEQIRELEDSLQIGSFAVEERKEVEKLRKDFDSKKIPHELIDAAEKRIEELADSEFILGKIAEDKDKKGKLEQDCDEIEEEIRKLEIRLERGDEISDKSLMLKELHARLTEIEFEPTQLENIEREIAAHLRYDDERHSLKAAREKEMELAERNKSMENKLSESKRNGLEMLSEIEKKRGQIPDADEIERMLNSAQMALESATAYHRTAAVEFSQAKSKEETRETLIRERKHAENEKGEIESKARLYRLLAEAMGKKGVPAFVIANALPEIEREADRLLALLTGDEMSLKLATARGEKELDTLEVQISTPTGDSPYENFSGGEAFRLDFALRVALSRFLARGGGGISTLIIDEGFGTQDDEGLALLSEAIRAIEEEFELIIVITHLERFKEDFDQIIEITKTPEKGSFPKVYA